MSLVIWGIHIRRLFSENGYYVNCDIMFLVVPPAVPYRLSFCDTTITRDPEPLRQHSSSLREMRSYTVSRFPTYTALFLSQQMGKASYSGRPLRVGLHPKLPSARM